MINQHSQANKGSHHFRLGPSRQADAGVTLQRHLCLDTEVVYWQGLHFSIAENDEDCTTVFSAVLDARGCEVMAAQCLEQLRNDNPEAFRRVLAAAERAA